MANCLSEIVHSICVCLDKVVADMEEAEAAAVSVYHWKKRGLSLASKEQVQIKVKQVYCSSHGCAYDGDDYLSDKVRHFVDCNRSAGKSPFQEAYDSLSHS